MLRCVGEHHSGPAHLCCSVGRQDQAPCDPSHPRAAELKEQRAGFYEALPEPWVLKLQVMSFQSDKAMVIPDDPAISPSNSQAGNVGIGFHSEPGHIYNVSLNE